MERTMYFLSAKYNLLLILHAAETVLLLRLLAVGLIWCELH